VQKTNWNLKNKDLKKSSHLNGKRIRNFKMMEGRYRRREEERDSARQRRGDEEII
jgi:hypothetical protein